MRFSHRTFEQSYDLVITGQNKNTWECFWSSGPPQRYSNLVCPVKVCIWPFASGVAMGRICWEYRDELLLPWLRLSYLASAGSRWRWSDDQQREHSLAALHPRNPSSRSPSFLQKCLQWLFPHDSNSIVIAFSHIKTRKPTRLKLSELMLIPLRRPHSAPASCTSADYACACVLGLLP